MQLQEGFDIGTWLFPMLILVGLCFLGLVIWLIALLMRTKNKPDTPSMPPHQVKEQDDEASKEAIPFVLAIRRSGSAWEIYVNGQRANIYTAPYSSSTRKEAIEALRELARFARDKLQGSASSGQAVTEPPVGISPAQSDMSSRALKTAAGDLVSGTAHSRPYSNMPPDAPVPSRGVPVMDLAREIGEIVDELIAASPALQNHAVTLMNAQTQGINFVVDGAVYNTVEDIPNPEIQALIRKATREWERR